MVKFEELFDGTLGDFKTQPVRFHLKEGERPYHGKPYPIPQSRLLLIKKEVARLCKIGVLKRQPESEWGSPAFVIPKSNQTVRFLGNFREVNKRIVRNPITGSKNAITAVSYQSHCQTVGYW